MAYSIAIKQKAIALRKEGLSLREIVNELNIAKSTASEWLSPIELSPTAQARLKEKQILGQYKTVLLKKEYKEQQRQIARKMAKDILQSIQLSKTFFKLCCALVWWCEGNKDTTQLTFTNSDPSLVKCFLFLLRGGFTIDESKFRILIHLHDYHEDEKQKHFWSEITNIPQSQFYKSYLKPHTAVRKHENYQGCIAISYYDAKIAKELEAIYNAFSESGGVG